MRLRLLILEYLKYSRNKKYVTFYSVKETAYGKLAFQLADNNLWYRPALPLGGKDLMPEVTGKFLNVTS